MNVWYLLLMLFGLCLVVGPMWALYPHGGFIGLSEKIKRYWLVLIFSVIVVGLWTSVIFGILFTESLRENNNPANPQVEHITAPEIQSSDQFNTVD